MDLLLMLVRPLRARIRLSAEPLRRIRTDRFGYTLWAVALTLLIAAPVPLLLALVGLMLAGASGPEGFVHAVGHGLLRVAPGLHWLQAFRLFCMPGGVADRHFRWRNDTLQRLHRYLNLAIWMLLPIGFFSAVVNGLGEVQAATLLTLGGGVGLWALWSDVLPALGVLERIPLWYSSILVDGASRILPVTLADLGLVLIIATGATVAVRHLPALLKILLLKHTNVSAGGRNTIATLTGYTIIAVALLQGAGRLGLNWEQVQWLVAALSVGIGFGLREIVANFIAGLILLFERPVRIGDTVSVGLNYGEVTHIDARAITVRIRDRREVLVPNNQLITQEVINWTLSDQVNRGEIRLSIEYGSDTEDALRILAEVAAAHPRVLTDPPRVIAAAEFGEHGLELLFRYFLPTLSNRHQIRGELIMAIDRQLRAAGIPIGLPQRDVWLRDGAPTQGVDPR